MAHLPTNPMLTDPASPVLRWINARPVLAWSLLAALVGLMAAVVVGVAA